jgi:hypothetical protein
MLVRYFRLGFLGGMIGGLGCFLLFFFTFLSGVMSPMVRLFDFWIPAVVTVFFIIWIKALKPKSEAFHFWEGLVYGNQIFWLTGLFSGLMIYFCTLVYPVPFENFIASSVKYLELSDKNLPDKLKMPQLDLVLKEMKETRPGFMIWDELKKKVLYSFVLVPIIAVLVRRKAIEN